MGFDLKHALDVASEFEYGTDEWLVALLHDAIEDGAVQWNNLRGLGLPPHIIRAIMWITRHHGETYSKYIEEIAKNPLARKVKIADLESNLARMDEGHESLRPRYEKALDTLLSHEPHEELPPRGR